MGLCGHTVATAGIAGLGTSATRSRVATLLLLHSAAARALAGDVSYLTALIAFSAVAAAAPTEVAAAAASTEITAGGSRGLTTLAREMSWNTVSSK